MLQLTSRGMRFIDERERNREPTERGPQPHPTLPRPRQSGASGEPLSASAIRYDLLLSYCVENVFTIENTFVIESGGLFTHANAADGKFAVLARPA
jgi:hypothetical protein